MAVLLQIDFPYQGPFNKSMTTAMADLANSIAHEPGLLWKIWTESEDTHEAGGIYLFEDHKSAADYLAMHTKRLQAAGVNVINAKTFTVNEELSVLSKTPLALLHP